MPGCNPDFLTVVEMEKLKAEADAQTDQAALNVKNKETTAVPTDSESPDVIDVSAGEDTNSKSVDDVKNKETTSVPTDPKSPDVIDISVGEDTNSKSIDDTKESTVSNGIVSKEDTTLTINEKTTKKRKRFTPAPDDTGPTTMPRVLIDASTVKTNYEKTGATDPKTGSKDSDVLFVHAAIASAESKMMSSTKPTPLVKAARPHIHSPQSKYFREWNMGERETEAL